MKYQYDTHTAIPLIKELRQRFSSLALIDAKNLMDMIRGVEQAAFDEGMLFQDRREHNKRSNAIRIALKTRKRLGLHVGRKKAR